MSPRAARPTSTTPRSARSPTASRRSSAAPGHARAYGTACAAGNYAIGAAARAIANGRVDCAVAGGVDPFSRIAMLGFARSRAMSNDRCRPFDRNRRGMQLGEGAAMLVLERESTARERGATVRRGHRRARAQRRRAPPDGAAPGRLRHRRSDRRGVGGGPGRAGGRRLGQRPRHRHATVRRRRGRRGGDGVRHVRRAARLVVEGCARPLHGCGLGDRGGAHRDRSGDGHDPAIGRLRGARRRAADRRRRGAAPGAGDAVGAQLRATPSAGSTRRC